MYPFRVAVCHEIAKQTHDAHVILRLEASGQVLSERVTSSERRKDFNPTTTPSVLNAWIRDNPTEDIVVEQTVSADKSIDEVFGQACSLIQAID